MGEGKKKKKEKGHAKLKVKMCNTKRELWAENK